jgi:hypothetical protein
MKTDIVGTSRGGSIASLFTLGLMGAAVIPPSVVSTPAFAKGQGETECVIAAVPGEAQAASLTTLHGPSGLPAPGAHFGAHGHLVLGEKAVFISHLPIFMFHPQRHPHNFQVIAEVTLSKPDADAQALYASDRAQNRDQIYSLDPEQFSITDLIADASEQAPERSPVESAGVLQSFTGDIHRGHFERVSEEERNNPLIPDATIEVVNVVYFQEFDPEGEKSSELVYLLFGKGEELFFAHLISAPPPDFDQLLSVNGGGHTFADDELRRGLRVTFPDRANSVEARIKEKDAFTCELRLNGDSDPARVQLRVERELFCEQGELAQVGFGPSSACQP